MKLTTFFAIVLFAQIGFAQKYIVLFKQKEIAINSLEHGQYQQLLQSTNSDSITQLNDWLGTRGVRTSLSDLWLVRGASLELNPSLAEALKKESWVENVQLDKTRKYVNPRSDLTVKPTLKALTGDTEMPWGVQHIGFQQIKAEFPHLTGEGVRVGILDTGIQSRHPEFASAIPMGTKVTFYDFVNKLGFSYDDHGHGTHVAGTIAGVDVGLAPKATLIIGKVFTANGSGTDSEILSAMQWMFDPDGNTETADYPHLVSNSWGADLATEFNDIDDVEAYRLAVLAWVNGGIIPVFAAGNSETSPNGVPGGLPEAIAVGALAADGNIADFSSRGPNIWKMGPSLITLLKPDISAPGVDVASAVPGNQYATWSGTSMATPHVSGAIALLLQANPKLRVAEVKALLMQTAKKRVDVSYGYGELNAYELIKAVTSRK